MREEAATPGGLNEQSLRTLGSSEHFTLAEKVRIFSLSPIYLSPSISLSPSIYLPPSIYLSPYLSFSIYLSIYLSI